MCRARILIPMFVAAGVTACARPEPATKPPVPVVTDSSDEPQARPTKPPIRRSGIHLAPGTYRYLVINDASITVGGDTSQKAQTSSRAYYTLTVSNPDGQIQQGSLDSIDVRRQQPIPTPVPDDTPALPLHWSMDRTLEDCTPEEQLIKQGREILPALPPSNSTLHSWTDSTSIVFCIPGHPAWRAQQRLIHRYEIVGAADFRGDSAFLIRRESQVYIASDRSSAMPIVITGNGTSSSQFYLTLERDRLLARTSDGTIELRISTSSRTHIVRQELREQTSLLPAPLR